MPATTLSRLRAGTLGLALATAATTGVTTALVVAPAHAATAGTITGRVTNSAGTALEEMDVTAFRNVAGAWTEEVATTETEEDGTYTLPIEGGTYRIEFTDSADEYVDQWWDRAATADAATDVVVDGGEAGGRNAVLSPSGDALVNLTLPRITGTPAFGAKLKADPGTWSQPGATFTYEWLVLGRTKLGGTGQTFTLEQPADKPAKLRVVLVVTAHAPGFDDVDAGTDELEVTGTGDDGGKGGSKGALSVTRAPKITGKAQVGHVLKVVPGKATPKARATYTWLRGSRAIAGATGRTYRPVAADAGKRLGVKVTWTRAGSAPVVARAPRTLPVKK